MQKRTFDKHIIILWLVFLAFMFIRMTISMTYWILLSLITCILAVVLLVKSKMPSGKYVRLSAAFAVIVTISYLGYQRTPSMLLYGLTAGIPTFLTSLAVFSVMEKSSGYALVNKKGRHPFLLSLGIGAAVGIVLSVINIYLPGDEGGKGFSLWKILLAINPGIAEEMAYRAIFMAYCCWFSGGRKMSRFSLFTMYFMMIIPHSASHGYDFISTLVLALLFGLPFALLQKKLDITSAMVSHFLVDAVRFIVCGI